MDTTDALTPEVQAQIERIERIHRNTEKLQRENAILEQNITRLAERLRQASIRVTPATSTPVVEFEEPNAEPAGLFDSTPSASSAFDKIEAKLEEYKATIRGKIIDRYHTLDGIAAAADAHQHNIRARLNRL